MKHATKYDVIFWTALVIANIHAANNLVWPAIAWLVVATGVFVLDIFTNRSLNARQSGSRSDSSES